MKNLIKSTVALLIVLLCSAGNLSAQTPQYYNYQNQGTNVNNFPFWVTGGKAVNWLFRAGEINQPNPVSSGNSITKVYFYAITGNGSRTYTDLRILLAQANITDLTSGSFYTGTYDTVLYRPNMEITGPDSTWISITLDRPFPYDPTKSLIMFIGHCGFTGVYGIGVRQISVSGIRRVWSVGGCPFVPYNGSDQQIVNFGIDVTPTSKITPINTLKVDSYILEQNYPNPFNSMTNVKFQIVKTENTTIKVFDISGKEVSTLVNESLQPGNYEVQFDAGNLPSGVYYYRLQTENYTETKRMTLVK